MEILRNFAVIEGCDGSGTTTQIGILERFFDRGRDSPPPFYITFEPTNGSIGKMIRAALRNEISLEPETVALLFAADRNEHLFGPDGVAERCRRGELVISDRYLPSSLVYQGITCGDEFPALLNRGFPAPELLIFLDIEPETAEKRMAARGQKEIFEYLEFQVSARERYKALLPRFAEQGVRVEIIDGSLPPEEVARKIWNAVEKMPILKR